MAEEIRWIGWDLSTTACSAIGRTEEGTEVFASVPMQGKTTLAGQPAHYLGYILIMMDEVLFEFEAQGFTFGKKGATCFSVRQHDLALLDNAGNFLVPALSWEFEYDPVQGIEERDSLKAQGFEKIVGPIDKRFLTPKLMWLLKQGRPELRQIKMVMTTGDAIGYALTGKARISTSDGMSNAILDQRKQLAYDVLQWAGFVLSWFPQPIQSGRVVGYIQEPQENDIWYMIKERLAGWEYRAGLGDNDAGARGSGLNNFITIVVSLGSSGTATRIARAEDALIGRAGILTFEYFHNRLLLNMLGLCGSWYNKFLENSEQARNKSHKELDELAEKVPFQSIETIAPEVYPSDWEQWDLGLQIATIQKSIALEMAKRIYDMLLEVQEPQAPKIQKIVITGGLKRSPLILRALKYYLAALGKFEIYVSALEEPFASQAASRGALITAMLPAWDFDSYCQLADQMCPVKPLEI